MVVPRQEIKAVVRFTEHLRAPELSNPSDCAAHSITALTSRVQSSVNLGGRNRSYSSAVRRLKSKNPEKTHTHTDTVRRSDRWIDG